MYDFNEVKWIVSPDESNSFWFILGGKRIAILNCIEDLKNNPRYLLTLVDNIGGAIVYNKVLKATTLEEAKAETERMIAVAYLDHIEAIQENLEHQQSILKNLMAFHKTDKKLVEDVFLNKSADDCMKNIQRKCELLNCFIIFDGEDVRIETETDFYTLHFNDRNICDNVEIFKK